MLEYRKWVSLDKFQNTDHQVAVVHQLNDNAILINPPQIP